MKYWSLFLCLRYLCRKRIVLLSAAAVMLSCALLITVASLFTGFIQTFESSAQNYLGDILVRSAPFEEYSRLVAAIEAIPQVQTASPVLTANGLLLCGPGQVRPSQVRGIDLQSAMGVSPIREALLKQKSLPQENIAFSADGSIGGFVGIGLLASPDSKTDMYDKAEITSAIGRKAALTTGTAQDNSHSGGSSQAVRFSRKVLRFAIADVFESGVYEFDQNFVFVPIEALSACLYPDKPAQADTIQIRLRSGADEQAALAAVEQAWRQFSGGKSMASIMTAGQMQEVMIAEYRKQLDVLMMVFGVVSGGVVLLVFCVFYLIVLTRQKDIAIAKSCGASRLSAAGLFLMFAAATGGIGTVSGVIGGWLITTHINKIDAWLASAFGLKIWKASTYLFTTIPDQVNWHWAAGICAAAMAAAVVGAVLPAIAAARVEPVKILRYE